MTFLDTIELRQQLAAYKAKINPENITDLTRSLLIALKSTWPKWMDALIIVKPETLIYWQQRRFKKYWAAKSTKKNQPGRPSIKVEIRRLIRRMATENLSWGAPRIYSEILMLGYGHKAKSDRLQMPLAKWCGRALCLSVRNDMLNHIVIFNEEQLRDLLKQYVEYYNNERCHLSVDRDSPTGREIQYKPFGSARVISFPRIGGLHHIYKWDKAA